MYNMLTIAQRTITQLARDPRTLALILIVPIVISSLIGVSLPSKEMLNLTLPAILAMLGYRGWVESVPCLFTPRQAEAAESVLSVLPHDPAAAEHRLKRYLIGRYAEVTSTEDGL